MKTYVPKELMKEGWQTRKSDREIKNNWNAERDVFTYLNIDTPIEDVIERYTNLLNEEPPSKGKSKGFFQRLYWGACHHGINTFVKRCPICDEQHRACIFYLRNLVDRVRKFNEEKSSDDSKNVQHPI